jgi:hypothetical protein
VVPQATNVVTIMSHSQRRIGLARPTIKRSDNMVIPEKAANSEAAEHIPSATYLQ